MGNRGPKPRGKVDTAWRPELAYATGLIVADGSLSKDGRHIDFTSKDENLVKTYQKCLSIESIKIGEKSSGGFSKNVYYRVQFGDVLFYRWLQEIGLTHNKSLTLGELNIHSDYFFDFVRGEWDGDGTIYCSEDKRWRNSFVVSIAFASGSIYFLKWLQKEINIRLETTGCIYESEKVLQLRYARKDSRVLFDAMFYNTKVPHLKRKFAKAQKIFRITGLK